MPSTRLDRTQRFIRRPALTILVSDKAWARQDVQPRSTKEAARLEFHLMPGAGDAVFTMENGRQRTPLNQLCASTAHLLNLQSVLELVLIFFGIHLEATKDRQCTHTHGVSKEYCPLVPPSKQVNSIVFCRLPWGESKPAASADPGDLFMNVTPLQMCQPLWDFVDPAAHSRCVVYVHLTARPRARPGLPHQLLLKLAQTFGIAGTAYEHEDENDRLSSESILGKRKRDGKNEDAEKERFKTQFRLALIRTNREVCALLGDPTNVEAAHLLPQRVDPEIAQLALESVFGPEGLDSQPSTLPTTSQMHCMPLFARNALPIPEQLMSMYDDEFLGLLLCVQLHKSLDVDLSLMILRGASVLLGLPMSRVQLACFQPACPTIRYNTEDEFKWSDMHQEQFQHEKEVRPRLGFNIPVQKWAALHLNAAMCFFKHCMKHCKGAQALIQVLINDAEPAEEVIPPTSASAEARTDVTESAQVNLSKPGTPTSSSAARKAERPLPTSSAKQEAESIASALVREYRELEAEYIEAEGDGEDLFKLQDEITAIMALCTLATCAGPTPTHTRMPMSASSAAKTSSPSS
ncbi:hypothetical protein OC842_006997 [Tilletia horrida]|uniref:Uncharacterized protein n=1 Tax=Tilletia horrida TaxID=155126 RepID=A0AAN6G7I9_9BASI|nr:hypothetical protein OC842_006997 [Tilletia horrida]